MRIIHTADLHLGQVMYQNYTREDEHDHFFSQLEEWCRLYHPDALLVSGDIFDIQQPGAHVKSLFNRYFVNLHRAFPGMAIVITAGNHDSASRIQADNAVWSLGNVTVVGMPPSADSLSKPDGWQQDYIVALPQGYIVALPFMAYVRKDIIQSILNYIDTRNTDRKPVVLMGHMAVSGMDATGHGFEIGTLQTLNPDDLGSGFDYMALGHIHKPQTIGFPDEHSPSSTYPPGIIRYSGSPLHVSCDEKYPHTVSLVDLQSHNGPVTVTRLRIQQLRHFYELPLSGPATSADEVLAAVSQFVQQHASGYFRLVVDGHAELPPNLHQQIYRLIEPSNDEIRFNPNTIITSLPDAPLPDALPTFQIAELQQMTDPMEFIRQTQSQYPELDIQLLAQAFKEVENELRSISNETPSENNEN